MKELPYTKRNRLADVLALIQVLALYKHAFRTQGGIKEEFQGEPISAESWISVAKEHQEFFRVREGKGTEISLIARYAQENHAELTPEYTAKLMETAIKIHDSQLNSSRWWTFWMPVIGAFMGVLLAKFFTK
jgi:hypothetical protein